MDELIRRVDAMRFALQLYHHLNAKAKEDQAAGDIAGKAINRAGAEIARALVQWTMEMPEAVVHCRDCRELMFSDCYGECRKGCLAGIVRPEDYCSRGVRKEERHDDTGGDAGLGAPLPAGDGGPVRLSDGGGAGPAGGAGAPDQEDGAGCCIQGTGEQQMN